MPRVTRTAVGGEVYHIINRANNRLQIFNTDTDYKHFEALLLEAKELTGMRILAYCIMPNHFHLVLYPQTDADMSAFMGWLTTTHVRQYRARTKSVGYGHLYQGRYKSFIVQNDTHLLTLMKYVEQNPLRAKLVQKAQDWQWSSLWKRENGNAKEKKILDTVPVTLPNNHLSFVNEPVAEDTVTELRYSVNKGKPYGTMTWVEHMIEACNLQHTVRGPGRPKGK